jgi:Pentapeptide repeats (9 copies)
VDTNSNNSAQKKIVSVEIMHLDDEGYGPEGKLTRRNWRQVCLRYLLKSNYDFETWQKSLADQAKPNLKNVSFEAIILYDDGSKLEDSEDYWNHGFMLGTRSWQRPYALDFVGASFPHELTIDSVTFRQTVLFNYASFSRDANFHSCTFSENAYFIKTNFNGNLDFQNSTVDLNVYFACTTFSRNAYFSNATFNSVANFNDSTFFNGAYFRNTTFNESSNFCRAIFCYGSIFENAVFKNVGHFEEANFIKSTPSFRGCKIDCTRLEFSDDRYFSKNENTLDAIKNISFLKRLSDEHGQTDQALNFNAMELRAKRLQVDASWPFRLTTWLYERVSDYGRSLYRPLICYFGLLICTFTIALMHAAFNSPKDCKGEHWRLFSDLARTETRCIGDIANEKFKLSGYRAAFEYSLYRAAGVLDFSDNDKATDAVAHRLFGQAFEPWWMRIFGAIKAIFCTAFLFLAALGLRNKYRIK